MKKIHKNPKGERETNVELYNAGRGGGMLRERMESRQTGYEIVLLDELVPQDH